MRIATIDLHESTLLPALVARLRGDAPGLDLHFQPIERHRLSRSARCRGTRSRDCADSRRSLRSARRAAVARSAGHADRREQSAAAADDARVLRRRRPCSRRRPCPGRREGKGASLVDTILAARGLQRRIAVVLPSAAGLPFVVAKTDLIATLPSRIFKDLAADPACGWSPRLCRRWRSAPTFSGIRGRRMSPLFRWVRAMIKETAAEL